MIKFFYDLMIYLTTNYGSMPESFRKQFPEEILVNARQVIFDIYSSETSDFEDYE